MSDKFDTIELAHEGDLFFDRTGSKILAIEMLFDAAIIFEKNVQSPKGIKERADEKSWLLGECESAFSGLMCFEALGNQDTDTQSAAQRFLSAAETDPAALVSAMRVARTKVRNESFEFACEMGMDTSIQDRRPERDRSASAY